MEKGSDEARKERFNQRFSQERGRREHAPISTAARKLPARLVGRNRGDVGLPFVDLSEEGFRAVVARTVNPVDLLLNARFDAHAVQRTNRSDDVTRAET
jgi:hypothetical protein